MPNCFCKSIQGITQGFVKPLTLVDRQFIICLDKTHSYRLLNQASQFTANHYEPLNPSSIIPFLICYALEAMHSEQRLDQTICVDLTSAIYACVFLLNSRQYTSSNSGLIGKAAFALIDFWFDPNDVSESDLWALTHALTCLKFQLRKLLPPSRSIEPFSGVIAFGDELKQLEREVKQEEGAKQAAAKTISPTADGGEAESELLHQETETNLETVTEYSDNQRAEFEQNYVEDGVEPGTDTLDQEPATQDTVEITQETADTPVSDNTPISANVALIKNLTADAPDLAQKFFGWLQKGLLEKTIIINNPAAEVHIVEEGIFLLAPAIFKTFLRLHGIDEEKHKNLSKRFRSLRKNIRNNDVNIHSYWVTSSNRASKINGWLLPFNTVYENDFPIPKPNKYIKKTLGDNEMST